MDLESGCIFWPTLHLEQASYAPLRKNLRCRVAVIGCGITGALVGYHLAKAGVETVAIDRRQPCTGSTAASTGLLQYECDTSLCELIQKLGDVRAKRAYQICYEALDKFTRLVAEINDPCDLTPRQSLYLAGDSSDIKPLRQECAARNACGIPVEFLAESQIAERFSFRRTAALWSYTAAQVDPYHLTSVLLSRGSQRGLHVYGHTAMKSYHALPGCIIIETDAGYEIEADRIVFATGYETPELLGRYIGKLKSTYALVSQPLDNFDGWFRRCLIWETARPYFYGRTTADGRAMIGGEDEDVVDPVLRDRLILAKTKALTRKFRDLFPQISMERACAWAGTFAETRDGLPYIGAHPEFPHAYFALGYGGNGILFGLIAAEMIRDLLLGIENPDAPIFAFSR